MVVIEFIYKFLLEVVDDFCVLEVVNIELVNIVCILMFSFGFDLPFHKCPALHQHQWRLLFCIHLVDFMIEQCQVPMHEVQMLSGDFVPFLLTKHGVSDPRVMCLAHLVRRRVLLALMLPTPSLTIAPFHSVWFFPTLVLKFPERMIFFSLGIEERMLSSLE